MLVCIKDLVNKIPPSVKVDIRSRNSDGSLKYEHQNGHVSLYTRELLKVKHKRYGKQKNLFIQWEGPPTGLLDDSRRYSSVSIDLADEYYLEIIE